MPDGYIGKLFVAYRISGDEVSLVNVGGDITEAVLVAVDHVLIERDVGLSDFGCGVLEDQTEESSLVTVKDGRDHVAAVEGVEDGDSDGVGLGVLDGVSELEVLASAEAPAGFDGQLSLVGGATGAQCQAGCEAQPRARR